MDANTEPEPNPLAPLEKRFDDAMMGIYESAGREVGYWATRYLQMLRRKGGLETAHQLLNAKTTSDGYAHLRDAGRLDLTVEALVLRPEFAPLFSPEERARAAERLAYYEQAMREDQAGREPADPALLELLAQVAAAPPGERIGYRDRVAAFGDPAIGAVLDWAAAGNSPGFACSAIEAIGRRGSRAMAVRGLGRLRSREPGWAGIIDEAIERLERRSGQ